jgi:hypothetical protein
MHYFLVHSLNPGVSGRKAGIPQGYKGAPFHRVIKSMPASFQQLDVHHVHSVLRKIWNLPFIVGLQTLWFKAGIF